MEKLREEHKKDLDHAKNDSERSLNDIKYIYEQEKEALEARLVKANQEIKNLQGIKEQTANNSVVIRDMQNNYLLEIQELNAHLDAFKKQSYEEIACLKKQRDDAYKKIESLLASNGSKNSIGKITSNKALTQGKGKQKNAAVVELSEGIQKELAKLRKQNNDLKSYVTKLEISEKKLKSLLSQKENTVEASGKQVLQKKSQNTASCKDLMKKKFEEPKTVQTKQEKNKNILQSEITELNVIGIFQYIKNAKEYTSEQTKGNEVGNNVQIMTERGQESMGGYQFYKSEHEYFCS